MKTPEPTTLERRRNFRITMKRRKSKRSEETLNGVEKLNKNLTDCWAIDKNRDGNGNGQPVQ